MIERGHYRYLQQDNKQKFWKTRTQSGTIRLQLERCLSTAHPSVCHVSASKVPMASHCLQEGQILSKALHSVARGHPTRLSIHVELELLSSLHYGPRDHASARSFPSIRRVRAEK